MRNSTVRKDKKTGDYTDGAIFIYERTPKAAKFLLERFQRDDLDEEWDETWETWYAIWQSLDRRTRKIINV